MILLDTSVLIDSLSGPKRSAPALRKAIVLGERIAIPSLVLYEWLRRPRIPEELSAQEALFPTAESVHFGPEEASLAAVLYGSVPRPRGREMDLAIASCAISWDAVLWTLNVDDFTDIPGLLMSRPG